MTLPLYREIGEVTGREPVGAVLTIGKKGERGNPVETDRFHFVSPYEVNGVRAPHPDFRKFNEAKPEMRQVLNANLVHATIDEAWLYHLRAQKLPAPNPNHPGRLPSCTGDSHRATRFKGLNPDGSAIWEEIECPANFCPFRQGSPCACKPFGRLYLRPRWEGGSLPTPLCKWTTGSWNSISHIVGFFDHIRSQAHNLGLESWSVYGLPFTLTLGRKTQPQHQRAFPVVSISPSIDLVEFFMLQRKRLAEAGGHLAIAASNTTPEESAPEVIAVDALTIVPGVPGETLAPPDDEVEAEVVAAADREQEEIEAALGAIDRELHRLCGDNEKNRAVVRFSCMGVRSQEQVRRLSLDALSAGLEALRAAR